MTHIDLDVGRRDAFDHRGDFSFQNIACAEFHEVLLIGVFRAYITGRPSADKELCPWARKSIRMA